MAGDSMKKNDLLLIALGAGNKHLHTPVQIQKLLFLIDKNVNHLIGGPVFNFVPYDYGPFDSSLYDELSKLENEGLVCSSTSVHGWKLHGLTEEGIIKSNELANSLSPESLSYIKNLSEFVRRLSFSELVSAIYKAYPEMKTNSVFRG
jgi:uncharacterized protein